MSGRNSPSVDEMLDKAAEERFTEEEANRLLYGDLNEPQQDSSHPGSQTGDMDLDEPDVIVESEEEVTPISNILSLLADGFGNNFIGKLQEFLQML